MTRKLNRIARLMAEAAADLSHDEIRDALYSVICDLYGADPNDWEGPHPWTRDVFDDTVVWEWDSKTWRATYTIDGTDATLGDPEEVRISYTAVGAVEVDTASRAMHEAFVADLSRDVEFRASVARVLERLDGPDERELVDLVEAAPPFTMSEAALAADGSTVVRVIEPGWGSSGYYGADVLERDAPAAWPAGTHMFWNHPSLTEQRDRPERDLTDLAGKLLEDAAWDPIGPKDKDGVAMGPGVYAPAQVFTTYREPVQEMAGDIGVSIRSPGLLVPGEAEGRRGNIVEEIAPGGTVDFVTAAGRGGKVVQMFEAARRTSRPPIDPKEGDVDLKEAQTKLAEAQATIDEANRKAQEAIDRAERAETATRIASAERVTREALRESKLSEAVVARVIEQATSNPPAREDGTLDEDKLKESVSKIAESERSYLSGVLGRTSVTGLGESDADDPRPASASPWGKPEDAFSEAERKDIDAGLESIAETLGMEEDTRKEFVTGRR